MKKNKIIFWTVTGFLFLFEGVMPMSSLFMGKEVYAAGTRALGYPDYFAVALIVCKFLGATAIILPQVPQRIKEWAYVGLSFNLIFASISHTAVDGNITFVLLPLVIGGLLVLSYFYQRKIRSNEQFTKSAVNL